MRGPRVLVLGANGQIGSELVEYLAARYGNESVLGSDLAPQGRVPGIAYRSLNVLDTQALRTTVEDHDIEQVYLLVAALSAKGEQ